jgi:hypothetical protein
MKKIIKKGWLLFVFFSIVANAQGNRSFSKVEELHNQKWEFLVEKAQLSPREIELVQPVFMEYEKTLWDLHEKNRRLFKSLSNQRDAGNINYAEINDRTADIELTQAQLFKSYHLKLRKILHSETLFNYYKAEREFKRVLLQKLSNRHHPERGFATPQN